MESKGKEDNTTTKSSETLSPQVLEYYKNYSQSKNLPEYLCGESSTTTATCKDAVFKSLGIKITDVDIKTPDFKEDMIQPHISAKERKKWGKSSVTVPTNEVFTQVLSSHDPVIEYVPESSPTSSLASNYKLEWDNGGDIGYDNAETHKILRKSASLPVLTTGQCVFAQKDLSQAQFTETDIEQQKAPFDNQKISQRNRSPTDTIKFQVFSDCTTESGDSSSTKNQQNPSSSSSSSVPQKHPSSSSNSSNVKTSQEEFFKHSPDFMKMLQKKVGMPVAESTPITQIETTAYVETPVLVQKSNARRSRKLSTEIHVMDVQPQTSTVELKGNSKIEYIVEEATTLSRKSSSCENLNFSPRTANQIKQWHSQLDLSIAERSRYLSHYQNAKVLKLCVSKPVIVECPVVRDSKTASDKFIQTSLTRNLSIAVQTDGDSSGITKDCVTKTTSYKMEPKYVEKQSILYVYHSDTDKERRSSTTPTDSDILLSKCYSFEYLYGDEYIKNKETVQVAAPVQHGTVPLPVNNEEDTINQHVASNLKRCSPKSDLTNVTPKSDEKLPSSNDSTSKESPLGQLIANKQSSHLIPDVEKSFELLQKLMKSKKYDDVTKKYYFKKICKRIVDSEYIDDNSASSVDLVEGEIPSKSETCQIPSKIDKVLTKYCSDQEHAYLQENIPWVPARLNSEPEEFQPNFQQNLAGKNTTLQVPKLANHLVQTEELIEKGRIMEKQASRKVKSLTHLDDKTRSTHFRPIKDLSQKLQRNRLFTLASTEATSNSCSPLSIEEVNGASNNVQKSEHERLDTAKESFKSTEIRGWRDDKTRSEQSLDQGKKFGHALLQKEPDSLQNRGDYHTSNHLVHFAKRERHHQLNWIKNEISHLSKLKSLLEKDQKSNDSSPEPVHIKTIGAELARPHGSDMNSFHKSTTVYMITTEKSDSSSLKESDESPENRTSFPAKNITSSSRSTTLPQSKNVDRLRVQNSTGYRDYAIQEYHSESIPVQGERLEDGIQVFTSKTESGVKVRAVISPKIVENCPCTKNLGSKCLTDDKLSDNYSRYPSDSFPSSSKSNAYSQQAKITNNTRYLDSILNDDSLRTLMLQDNNIPLDINNKRLISKEEFIAGQPKGKGRTVIRRYTFEIPIRDGEPAESSKTDSRKYSNPQKYDRQMDGNWYNYKKSRDLGNFGASGASSTGKPTDDMEFVLPAANLYKNTSQTDKQTNSTKSTRSEHFTDVADEDKPSDVQNQNHQLKYRPSIDGESMAGLHGNHRKRHENQRHNINVEGSERQEYNDSGNVSDHAVKTIKSSLHSMQSSSKHDVKSEPFHGTNGGKVEQWFNVGESRKIGRSNNDTDVDTEETQSTDGKEDTHNKNLKRLQSGQTKSDKTSAGESGKVTKSNRTHNTEADTIKSSQHSMHLASTHAVQSEPLRGTNGRVDQQFNMEESRRIGVSTNADTAETQSRWVDGQRKSSNAQYFDKTSAGELLKDTKSNQIQKQNNRADTIKSSLHSIQSGRPHAVQSEPLRGANDRIDQRFNMGASHTTGELSRKAQDLNADVDTEKKQSRWVYGQSKSSNTQYLDKTAAGESHRDTKSKLAQKQHYGTESIKSSLHSIQSGRTHAVQSEPLRGANDRVDQLFTMGASHRTDVSSNDTTSRKAQDWKTDVETEGNQSRWADGQRKSSDAQYYDKTAAEEPRKDTKLNRGQKQNNGAGTEDTEARRHATKKLNKQLKQELGPHGINGKRRSNETQQLESEVGSGLGIPFDQKQEHHGKQYAKTVGGPSREGELVAKNLETKTSEQWSDGSEVDEHFKRDEYRGSAESQLEHELLSSQTKQRPYSGESREVEKKSAQSTSSDTSSSSSSESDEATNLSIHLCSCCKRDNINQLVRDVKRLNSDNYFLCHPCYAQNRRLNHDTAKPYYSYPGHVCQCYTVVETQTVRQIQRTVQDLNELEREERLSNYRRDKSRSNLAYCSRGKCYMKNERKKGYAYQLTFDPTTEKEKKKHKSKTASLEEIRMKIPVRRDEAQEKNLKKKRGHGDNRKTAEVSNGESGKENKREKKSSEKMDKDKKNKAKKPTLQEYLCANRPGFIQSAEQRRQCMIELAYMREQRCQNYKEFLASLADGIPVQSQQRSEIQSKRMFTSKEMKEITKKHYKKLPEVQQKLLDNRDKQIKVANRLLTDVFNKRLRHRVLNGKHNLSTNTNLIQLP